MRSRALLLCCISLLVGGVAFAEDFQFQLFDGNGNLLTDQPVGVMMRLPNGQATKFSLPASPDGTYSLAVAPGTKLQIGVSNNLMAQPVGITVPVFLPGPMPITVLQAPANDACANAVALGALPQSVNGTTTGATADPEAGGTCGTSIETGGVWYTVQGTGTTLIADTCNAGTSYDSKLSVYCGEDCADLQCVGGNDDFCGLQSSVTWCSENTVEYKIFVHGFFGANGPFTLDVQDTGVVCTPTTSCLPPPVTGACCTCLPSPFNCSVETEPDCAALAGEFQGGDTVCFPEGQAQVFTSTTSTPIPDGLAPNVPGPPAVNTITINSPGTICGDVMIHALIPHTWIGDLVIQVAHTNTGDVTTLWNRNCNGGPSLGLDATWADHGPFAGFCGGTASFTPSDPGFIDNTAVAPGSLPLTIFEGDDVSGTWTLTVTDFYSADTGTIQEWSVICSPIDQGPSICPIGPDDDDDDDDDTQECGPEADGKVTICHHTGNGGSHTIRVSPAAVPAHLNNHGDTCGECDQEPNIHHGIEATGSGSSNGPVDAGFGGSHQETRRTPGQRLGR